MGDLGRFFFIPLSSSRLLKIHSEPLPPLSPHSLSLCFFLSLFYSFSLSFSLSLSLSLSLLFLPSLSSFFLFLYLSIWIKTFTSRRKVPALRARPLFIIYISIYLFIYLSLFFLSNCQYLLVVIMFSIPFSPKYSLLFQAHAENLPSRAFFVTKLPKDTLSLSTRVLTNTV